MPNITITIGTPVLIAPDFFKVRYRPVNGVFSSTQNEDNDPFTLVGLAAGNYELETIVVKAGVDCPASITPFTVTDPYTCVVFTPSIVQNGNLFNLRLTYPAHTPPPCGWHITINGNVTQKTVNYAVLPASPLDIPIANEGLNVTVYADLCNGNQQVCLSEDLTSIQNPTCVGFGSPVTGALTIMGASGQGKLSVRLTITVNAQSTPVTQFVTFSGQQRVNTVKSGYIGSFQFPTYSFGPISGTSFSYIFDVGNDVVNSLVVVDWTVVDICGTKWDGTSSVLL